MTQRVLQLGNIRIDTEAMQIRVAGALVPVSFLQYRVLLHLVEHADRVVPPAMLLETIWGRPDRRSFPRLRALICRLRPSLRGSEPWQLRTVPKCGYGLLRIPAASAVRENRSVTLA